MIKVLGAAIAIVIGAVLALAVFALLGLILQVGWNGGMAPFPNIPKISWVQSLYLLVFASIIRTTFVPNIVRGSKKD